MSLDEYVKFVTQQIVLKIDEPKKKRKDERTERLPFWYHAFGMVPLGVNAFIKKRSPRKKK